MSKINLLDCTLRDGAYITKSIFGDNVIQGIIQNLQDANVEMIEVGWLKDSERIEGSTYYHTVQDIEKFMPKVKSPNSTFLIMMDYGRYNIDALTEYDGKSIDAVRLVFPKEKFEEAIDYSKIIKQKGYKLCLQAANTQSYSDAQLIQLAEKCNEVMPDSISIVDTFGVMYNTDLQRIFMILNNNLNKNIKLGFHSHNNLQLSFALSIEFISLGLATNRNIVVDSSLCGMGRGAGNTCTELITNYLNLKHNCNYDVNIIMDTIDMYMKGFIQNYKWGYTIPLCIAGQLGSHVNNIAYLQDTHNISYKDLKIVLSSLPKNERKLYNYDIIEEAYINYMNKKIDDKIIIDFLSQEFKGKEVLFIVPGSSVKFEEEKIKTFISKNNVQIIGINAYSENYDYDYLFFTNNVRYAYYQKHYANKKISVILTSNVKVEAGENEYIVNYNTIMRHGWKYFDNSTIMAMRLFSQLGVKTINFAGFDGYKIDSKQSYSDIILQNTLSDEEKINLNNDISDMIKDFVARDKFTTSLKFITESQFEKVIEDGVIINA